MGRIWYCHHELLVGRDLRARRVINWQKAGALGDRALTILVNSKGLSKMGRGILSRKCYLNRESLFWPELLTFD